MKRTVVRRKSESGSTLVEFGVAFFALFTLFTGVFQWGYSFYIYDHLSNAVRSGARYAGQKTFVPDAASTASNAYPTSCYMNAIKQLVVYGDPTATSGTPVVPGLTTSNIVVTGTYDSEGIPQRITVKLSTDNPYSINVLFGNVTFGGKPSFTFPFTGIYAEAATCP